MVCLCSNNFLFNYGFFALNFITKRIVPINIKWEPIFSLAILKKSFPYALLIMLMTIYYRLDVLMLEIIIGPQEAGFYMLLRIGFSKHLI